MSLSSTSIQRPVTIIMFTIGVVALGMIAFKNLAIDFLPPIKIPKLTVQTTYPNVSPEEVENTLTQPIESALGTVTGVKRTSSASREGISVVTAEFYWGTNMDFAMLEVREKLDQLRAGLPREAGRPTILKIDPSTEPVMTVAVSEKQREDRREMREEIALRSGAGPARLGGTISAGGAPSQLEGTQAGREENRERGSIGEKKENESTKYSQLVELKETARALIKRRIEQVEGVAQAAVLGGLEREIHVEIDMRKLQAHGLTLDQVSAALAAANLNLPGGTIKYGLFRYSLRTVGEFKRVDEIRNVIVAKISNGRTIRVSDIGSVSDTFKERAGLTRYNGSEIIALQVRKEAGTNTVQVSERVHTVLQQLRDEYPNLKLDVITDQAEFISKSIDDVEQAIVIGAFLAFLVLFFFLKGVRYPVIIGLCMPISILATFIVMYFIRINLNIISLTGLAIGIGMLGDNAIVVIENVTRLRERGMSLIESAIEGSREINLAVTASTLTNVAIFLPIIFVEGVASQLFLDMGITMTVSLLVSLVVAVTLVPMLVSRQIVLKRKDYSVRQYLKLAVALQRSMPGRIWFWITVPIRALLALSVWLYFNLLNLFDQLFTTISPPFHRIVDGVRSSSNAGLTRYLNWALQHRFTVVVGTVGLFILSILVSLTIKTEPAPDIDQSRFSVQVMMPKGSTLEGTSSFALQIEQVILKLHSVKGVYTSAGITDEQNYWTVSNAAAERADLEVKVSNQAETDNVITEVRATLARMQTSLSGVTFNVKKRGTTFEQILQPEQNDIKIRILGKDPATSFRIADEFAPKLREIPALVDLQTGAQKGSPEYRIVIDRDRAARYGLSVQTVAQAIAQHVRGKEATFLSDFDRKVTVRVQPVIEQQRTMEDLLAASITVGETSIPIRELIEWKRTEGYSEIWRENQQRAVLMTANVSGRSVGSVVEEIERRAAEFTFPAGYRISVGGENEEIQESFRSLFIVILLSLFLVYMILAAEYESILYPFVILLSSPLAFIGAIGAMVLAGQNYNVMSLIGIVIMIGAVDNDAVIAVDIITSMRRDGVALFDAVKEGMQKRLRPILMTTVTTVLGVIPLIFEFGTGSELVRALTIPLVGGLIASTLFTIVFIPIVYTYIDKWAIGRGSRG
ncbi:MAG: efflux RND transporter permease subunit [bacterium]